MSESNAGKKGLKRRKTPRLMPERRDDYFDELKAARAHLMATYMTADNSSAKVHALKCITRSLVKETKMTQSLGMLPNIPRRNGKGFEYFLSK